MSKILITGAAGFIGSHLTEKLSEMGHEVTGLDCFMGELYPSDLKRENWDEVKRKFPNTRLIEIDLRQDFGDSALYEFDYVYHLAAMPGLSLSWTNLKLYADCNLLATNNLINNLDLTVLKKFFYISTSSVYGEVVSGDEQSQLKPISPYGVTKLAGENLLSAYARSKSFEYAIFRLFSVYGPRQRSDMAFNIFIDSIIREKPINIFGDGSQARANTFVLDIVEALSRGLDHASNQQIYNICGTSVYSVIDVISGIEKILNKKAILKFGEERLGDQKKSNSVGGKAMQSLGFTPKVELLDGLREQIKWQNSRLENLNNS
jgi:nucleoside-diphosphate-sugar epimerase